MNEGKQDDDDNVLYLYLCIIFYINKYGAKRVNGNKWSKCLRTFSM